MSTIIGIVPYKILPAKMGGEKGIHLFYSALSKETSVTVIGTKSNESTSDISYNLIKIFSNSILRYLNVIVSFSILRIVKKEKPTLIVFEHPYMLIHQLFIRCLTRSKIAVHSHNIEYLRFKSLGQKWWWILQFWEGWSYKMANMVFFISEEDRAFAIQQWNLKKEKTMVMPYGIEIEKPVDRVERQNAKVAICKQLNIDISTTLFYFNGSLYYPPNAAALDDMREQLFPLLINKNPSGKYALIVTGARATNIQQNNIDKMGIPAFLLGFVDDIGMYYKGCDILLNLVRGGGGIKTKLVEALGYGMDAVSYLESAWGVDQNCTQKKLFCSDDITTITDAIIQMQQCPYQYTPLSYYEKYAWLNIAKRVNHLLHSYRASS